MGGGEVSQLALMRGVCRGSAPCAAAAWDEEMQVPFQQHKVRTAAATLSQAISVAEIAHTVAGRAIVVSARPCTIARVGHGWGQVAGLGVQRSAGGPGLSAAPRKRTGASSSSGGSKAAAAKRQQFGTRRCSSRCLWCMGRAGPSKWALACIARPSRCWLRAWRRDVQGGMLLSTSGGRGCTAWQHAHQQRGGRVGGITRG